MNAALKPLLTTRTEYIGYRHVSEGNYGDWVELNVDALAHNYFETGGLDLDGLAAFAAHEWQKQCDRRDDFANTLRQYE